MTLCMDVIEKMSYNTCQWEKESQNCCMPICCNSNVGASAIADVLTISADVRWQTALENNYGSQTMRDFRILPRCG